jgi:hypothetical protein
VALVRAELLGETLVGMTDVTRSIQYTGDPAEASTLVQVLQDEGISVEWTPPKEHQGIGTDADQVIVQLTAVGGIAAITAAVTKFRARVKHARVDVEGEAPGA